MPTGPRRRASASRRLHLAIGLALPLATACATGAIRIPYPASAPPNGAPSSGADPFPYPRAPLAMTSHDEANGLDHTVRWLTAPSTGENGQLGNLVTARYFQRTAPGRKPLVIVVPIWGGHPYPSTTVTRDLVGQGHVHVLLMLGDHYVVDWEAMSRAATPEVFARVTRQMAARIETTIIDIRRLMDWAEARPEIDARRIGLIGFSESTWQVAGVLGSDARPAAAVLVMGGAHPHDVIATCDGPPALVRARVMPRFGWSRMQFVRELARLFESVDPGRLHSRVDPGRVLVIDAKHDDCISPGAREALWLALGQPERISVLSSHKGAFMGMTFLGGNHLREAIGLFFARTLS